MFIFSSVTLLSFGSQAQGFKKFINNATHKDSTGKTGIQKVLQNSSKTPLSIDEIANGLKEALNVGANNAGQKLSAVDGFFKDAAIKILMPPEALKAEATLRKMGMGKLVDNAILSMNRAAEDAAKQAAPIFVDAIKKMTIQDAV